jgi:hypothetical protein
MNAVSEGVFMGRVDFMGIMNYYYLKWFMMWFILRYK